MAPRESKGRRPTPNESLRKSMMKTIFVGPQGIRTGWRFAIFVFLLFGFSKLLFWILTVFFDYQEHVGWFPTDFLLDGTLSFGAALVVDWNGWWGRGVRL